MIQEKTMLRVRWIEELGKEILFVDLKQATAAESLTALEEFNRNMQDRPQDSVLLLVDVTNCAYNSSVSARWKGESLARADFIRGSAIYGLGGMVALSLRGYAEVLRLMGFKVVDRQKYCKTRAEALAWLQQC
jgi:hypothetical protein